MKHFNVAAFGRLNLLAMLLAVASGAQAFGSTLTVGDILVSSLSRGKVFEYTLGGSLVQTFDVPDGDPNTAGIHSRDLILDRGGDIQIFNGTFSPSLTTLIPETSDFVNHTYPGWKIANNGSYGGIAANGRYIFVTTMSTSSDEPGGMLRIKRNDYSAIRFANIIPDRNYEDVTFDSDGLLYGLLSSQVIAIFDPETLVSLGAIHLRLNTDFRGIAIDSNGDIFVAGYNGNLYHLVRNPDGTHADVVDTLVTGKNNLSDIDIDASGRIIVGSRFGDVILTDRDFSSVTSFRVAIEDVLHVAFVPEPSTYSLAAIGVIGLLALRRRRSVAA